MLRGLSVTSTISQTQQGIVRATAWEFAAWAETILEVHDKNGYGCGFSAIIAPEPACTNGFQERHYSVLGYLSPAQGANRTIPNHA